MHRAFESMENEGVLLKNKCKTFNFKCVKHSKQLVSLPYLFWIPQFCTNENVCFSFLLVENGKDVLELTRPASERVSASLKSKS